MELLWLLTVISLFLQTQAIHIEYGCASIWEPELTYSCVASSIFASDSHDKIIESMNRTSHQEGFDSEAVTKFAISFNEVEHFPRGLSKFFSNMKSLEIFQTGLKEINEDDLVEFGGKLEHLKLSFNKISHISRNLFKNNPNLKEIDLSYNLIKTVEDGAFALQKLETLDFESNICHSDSALYDKNAVLKITRNIYTKCGLN